MICAIDRDFTHWGRELLTNEHDGITVEIGDLQSQVRIDRGVWVERTRRALAALGVDRGSISIVFVDDSAIREINKKQLGHDWATDVVTFPISDPGAESLEGEIVISTQTAVSWAVEENVDPDRELELYLVHGLLHLLGYDDRTEEDVARMRLRERELLNDRSDLDPAVASAVEIATDEERSSWGA